MPEIKQGCCFGLNPLSPDDCFNVWQEPESIWVKEISSLTCEVSFQPAARAQEFKM